MLSDLKLAIATNDLGLAERRVETLTADLAATHELLGGALAALDKAARATDDVADKVGIPWYWHPALWATIGMSVTLGVVLGCLEAAKALRF